MLEFKTDEELKRWPDFSLRALSEKKRKKPFGWISEMVCAL